MSYTNCPVCRRTKSYDDLVCGGCWETVTEGMKRQLELLSTQKDNETAYRKLCDAQRRVVQWLKDQRAAGKPFGFDVDVVCGHPQQVKSFHWRGTEASVRRKAQLQSHFVEVRALRPLSREQWIRAYGLGRM